MGRLPEALAAHDRAVTAAPMHFRFDIAMKSLPRATFCAAGTSSNGAGRTRKTGLGASASHGAARPSPAAPFCCMPSRASAIPCSSFATHRWWRHETAASCWRFSRPSCDCCRPCRAWSRSSREATPCHRSTCIVPLLSLPRAFAIRLETIPAEVPYLRADPAAAAAWQTKLPDNGKVRVGWCGRAHRITTTRARIRSIGAAPSRLPNLPRSATFRV